MWQPNKISKSLWCYWWDTSFLFSSAALSWPMPGENQWSKVTQFTALSDYMQHSSLFSWGKNPALSEHTMASKRRTSARGWFSYHQEHVSSKQNQGNTEMMMTLKMSDLFPLWHFPPGSLAQSKHGSNSDKFTIKHKWQTHLNCSVCSK